MSIYVARLGKTITPLMRLPEQRPKRNKNLN